MPNDMTNVHFLDETEELRFMLKNDLVRVRLSLPDIGSFAGREVILSDLLSREFLSNIHSVLDSTDDQLEDDLLDVVAFILAQKPPSRFRRYKLKMSPWEIFNFWPRRK